MTAAQPSPGEPICQLKVTLKGSKPPIWRRVQVPGSITLATLHRVIQVIMGWEDYHLHQFITREKYFGQRVPDFDFGPPMEDERAVKLIDVAPTEKTRFLYEYDFGDSWEHAILVEKILTAEKGVHYPICLTGKRACPPEDCGGIWGYYQLLETVQDPGDPEHEDMLDWLGDDFDPEAFDLDAINRELKDFTV